MGGPTSAQETIQQEDIQTMQNYNQEQQQQYAEQQALYAQVNSVLQPILAKGPNQEGFNAGEVETLNAQAVEGTAENYSAASRAMNENMAAEGGGTNPLPSGAQTELQEQMAQRAAGSESEQETQIQEANYAQGLSEFQNAESGEMAIATGQDPIGYMNAQTNQASAAGTVAQQIAQEQQAQASMWVGAGTALAGSAINQVGENWGTCWIAAELWGGWGDSRTILVRRWLWTDFHSRWYGRAILALYTRWGRQIAKAMQTKIWLRRIFKVIFEKALQAASR